MSKFVPKEELRDFRNFLFLVWQHLDLPHPTDLQYDIATWLQHGPHRLGVKAFRGAGKSWITSAFVLWCLYLNPQLNIMVVSAGRQRAANFTTFCLKLINEMPLLHHLKPGKNQRKSVENFDVGPAKTDQSPSMKSVGITGMITGDRADIVIADDIEIPRNSMTEGQRLKLSELVKEFDSILKPEGPQRIIYLGTPQCELSLYNVLQGRGYKFRIWPVRYPDPDRLKFYGARFSPWLHEQLKLQPALVGKPTEPGRFPDQVLIEREASYGRSGFALQFMLDTRLSDLYRFPLKLADLVTMACNDNLAPERVVWASSPELVNQVPTVGFEGDWFYRPMQVQGEWEPYSGSVMSIDPSGRGKDETAYAVVKYLNGFLYLVASGGRVGGYDDDTMAHLVGVAKKYKVNKVVIEKNYGDGMFQSLLKPWFDREYPCTLEEVFAVGNKEARIIDSLEPVMNQHRLVVDERLVREDFDSGQRDGDDKTQYQLFYQLTHLTRDRGSLAHEDRLEALAWAVRYWTDAMNRDAKKAMEKRASERIDEELREFMNGYYRTRGRPQQSRWTRRTNSRRGKI